MIYRLRNKSDSIFDNEGIRINPGTISCELTPEQYQRLLALYWHSPLEPLDDSDLTETGEKIDEELKADVTVAEQPIIAETIADAESDIIKSDIPDVSNSICADCHKVFKNKKGLDVHIKKMHA